MDKGLLKILNPDTEQKKEPQLKFSKIVALPALL
jgi:hypothetical protein